MNRREYLLNKLIQECAEVIQAATKCKEFGMLDIWPIGSTTNEDKLQTEYLELTAVMAMVKEECLATPEFSVEKSREIMIKKVDKVNHWSEYSRERGCLTEDER